MYPDKVTPYPRWAMILGFLMSTLSMLMIPIYAAYYLYTAPGKSFGEVSGLNLIAIADSWIVDFLPLLLQQSSVNFI